MTAARGVLFCGSIQLPDAEGEDIKGIFSSLTAALPNRLLRLPDGEPGRRQTFCAWQSSVFLKTPWIINGHMLQANGLNKEDHPPGNLDDIQLDPVQYDDYAIHSYQTFARLKAQGRIDRETRFQVCVPTPLNPVALYVNKEHQERVEPLYEELLLCALDRIQANIPHKDLAIQWDCPLETVLLDGGKIPFQVHFDVKLEPIIERLDRLASHISHDAQLGFHLCYGDFQHRHFLEPRDMSSMVRLTNALLSKIQRPINWIHMPVPIDRKDEAYFAALKDLNLQGHSETEIYLGLVHANDLEGTRERISVAQKIVPDLQFGVATECGLGRTPREEVASVFEILKMVSTPVLPSGM